MNEIGLMLKSARENAGVTKEEASEDLQIKILILENIENGNIGCFKDIFVLKDYIKRYSRYLGLDPEKTIDEFNEYLFEYTSKIPLKKIEKAVNEKESKKTKKSEEIDKISSPYTKIKSKHSSLKYVLIYIGIAVLIGLAILWAVKQITIGSNIATTVSYIR